MSDDERLDRLIRDAAKDYNQPPATPRAELWARIASERAARPVPRVRRLRWAGWAIGLAAALIMGVAIGRVTSRSPATAPTVARGADSVAEPALPAAYRLAATDHLSRVETFLSVFSADASAGHLSDADLEAPARQLLRRTRLLRASPVADDVALRALLDDIEFVLLQITSFAQVGDKQELDFAEQGINERSVLLRLRSALPTQPERQAAGGAL